MLRILYLFYVVLFLDLLVPSRVGDTQLFFSSESKHAKNAYNKALNFYPNIIEVKSRR